MKILKLNSSDFLALGFFVIVILAVVLINIYLPL